MRLRNRLLDATRSITATGVLLALALALAGAVAYQAHRAAAGQRAAARRLLRDHAAYAAAEFARRAASTLESGFVTLQAFPTQEVEGKPATTPLPSAAAYRRAVREQDLWCNCLSDVQRFFRLDLAGDGLEVAGPALSPEAEAWVRAEVRAHAAALVDDPARAEVYAYGEIEGRTERTRYQMRIQRATVRTRELGGRPLTLAFTVLFDDRERPRAAYGIVEDPRVVGVPVFRRIVTRVPLLPGTVTRGVPTDSLLAVSVSGPGGELYRSGHVASPSAAASEPFPGDFAALAARVELRPRAAERLAQGLPASPLPLLVALLALAAGVVGVAFLQLRRQAELSRLRADFVSGVSHELRTPLTQIRMFSELLLGGRLRTDQERERSLRLIDREARRLSYLVENVLDFSRGERGTLELAPQPTDVAALAAEVAEGFAPIAASRGMELRTELEPGVTAMLDRGAFRQVLLNFLDNAARYGPRGQRITLGTERAGNAVRVWVEDEGPGIPPALRGRVWEPYYRLDREVDRVAGGSGIGLSVVRDLVMRHGGRVRVEDGAGGGARFVAELPRAMEAAAPAEDAPALQEAGR
ncbi:MAG TPA: HAMP domain-containing sensor histidine kinase [Longimicrobium sp.]|nr:HAMP domain-containing sensor histidine kinase [Longimicrobium sp.]